MQTLDGLDYQKLYNDLMNWVARELHVKPRQAMAANEMKDIFEARGMVAAYEAVLYQAEVLRAEQLDPESVMDLEEDANG